MTLADWLMWLGGGAAAVFSGIGTVVKRNRDRSMENARRLEGDDNDDGYEGLMAIAKDTRGKVDRLEARMEREHREVMSRLDEISDSRSDD